MGLKSALLIVVTLVGSLAVTLLPAAAANADAPVTIAPPVVTGTPVNGAALTTDRGQWGGGVQSVTFRWLRDGKQIAGATARRLKLTSADVGSRISVAVVASSADGSQTRVVSAPTGVVRRAPLTNRRAPVVTGQLKYGQRLRATRGGWSATGVTVRYQWLRNGKAIGGADRAAYDLRPEDVGRRVRVRVTARKDGHFAGSAVSAQRGTVGHRVGVRRTVTYHVETRGRIRTDLGAFKRLAQQTFDDPRGWRGAGVKFRQVARGGRFTLVLSEASRVPSFSSGCSAQWSCRVGRFVVINQDRWRFASSGWNAAGGGLRGYQHMVVNHETGHWLGRGHVGCGGRGKLAPVMMQQSKGLGGCRFNPWPTGHELRTTR